MKMKKKKKITNDEKKKKERKIKEKEKKTIRTVSLFYFCFLNLFWTVLMISCVFVLCSLELFLLNIFGSSQHEREGDYKSITNRVGEIIGILQIGKEKKYRKKKRKNHQISSNNLNKIFVFEKSGFLWKRGI